MTHIEFLRAQGACTDGVQYASQHPTLDAAIKACTEYAWLTWAVDHLLDEPQRVAVRCYIVRHTPLADGRTVWDLITDERSRKRIEIEEAWARGEDVSDDDRAAAWAAAWAAARDAASSAARAAASSAARAAAWAAARDAAWDAVSTAAWDAVSSAARDAAWAAAWDAAWAAARDAAWDAVSAAVSAAARAWQMDYIRSLDWAQVHPAQSVTEAP